MCSKGDPSDAAVVWHVQLMAIPFSAAEVGRAAPEKEHRWAVLRVVRHPKEEVAEKVRVHSVVPRGGVGRKGILPHVERDLQVLLMVYVKVLQLLRCERGGEVDGEPVPAPLSVARPDTLQDVRGRVTELALRY